MTIFGFNTDVKQGEVVYHVQSEARQNDLLLQTLVFVKGQCVGKHTVSYAQKVSEPGFSTEAMHELLKLQHKGVLGAIQAGDFDSVLGTGAEIQDVGGTGLSLKWLDAGPDANSSALTLEIQVLDSGRPASGADISISPCGPADSPSLCRAKTDQAGSIKIAVPLNDDVLREHAVIVHAVHGGKSATRKVRLKK